MTITQLLQSDQEEEQGQVRGLAIGIVTKNQDEQGMSRVKVSYPWREDQESYWARMAVPMAGGERGTFFLPEVGDEVLLGFDQDDIRHPYMVGALWNGQDAPPETNSDGENNLRKIVSRAGHELTFDDTQAAENVEIITNAGHKVRLDDTAGGEKIEIEDKTGQNKIVIDSVANSMELESLTSLKISSAQIEIEATGTMSIKSSGTLTVQGSLVQIN